MSHQDFTFEGAPNTAAFICRHVREGAPILHVSHDSEGDWQFLCGQAQHSAADLLIGGVGHLVEGDPSIRRLAQLCTGHFADRPNLTAPWTEGDGTEAFIKECIADPGWSVQAIPEGENEDEPAFAYTIGHFHNYQHAELIVVGLRVELMHEMLNDLGERIKAGTKLVWPDKQGRFPNEAGTHEGFRRQQPLLP